MKKSRLWAFLVSGALLLTSCDFLNNLASYIPSGGLPGGSDSSVGVDVGEGGVEATFSEGLIAVYDALEKTRAENAIGLSLSVPSLETQAAHVTYTTDVNASGGDQNSSTITASCFYQDFSLSNMAVKLAASGLGGSDHQSLAAAATLSVESASYSVNHVDLNNNVIGNDNAKADYSAISGAAYIKGDDLYLDASNADLRSALNVIAGWVNPSLTFGEKTEYSGTLASFARPLLTVSALGDSLSTALAVMQARADLFSKYFAIVNYADGTSLFHGTIGSTAFIKMASVFESAFTGCSYDQSYAKMLDKFGSSSLKLALGLTFDSTGVTQLQINGNGTFVSAPTVEVVALSDTVTRNITTADTFKFSGGLVADFAYGEGVTVTIPEDLSAYQLQA